MRVIPGAAEVQFVRRRLIAWSRRQNFDYPWRTTANPWLALVAEVLLQRTRAAQVIPVYEQFARAYPTPESFLHDQDAYRVTSTLGLHARTQHLRGVAQALIDRLPAHERDLQTIRGVGEYTAAAWLSLHRGRRAVIVDANVFRWLARMTGNPYHRDPRGVRWVRKCADVLTPPRAFRAYNYAVLDFTMTICTPRVPRCEGCPLRTICVFGQTSP